MCGVTGASSAGGFVVVRAVLGGGRSGRGAVEWDITGWGSMVVGACWETVLRSCSMLLVGLARHRVFLMEASATVLSSTSSTLFNLLPGVMSALNLYVMASHNTHSVAQ